MATLLKFHDFPGEIIERKKLVQAIHWDESQDFTILWGSMFVASTMKQTTVQLLVSSGWKSGVLCPFQWNIWGVSQRESVYDQTTTDVRPDLSLKECCCEDVSPGGTAAPNHGKEWKIISGTLPLTLSGTVNQLCINCCLMTNFQGPLDLKGHIPVAHSMNVLLLHVVATNEFSFRQWWNGTCTFTQVLY